MIFHHSYQPSSLPSPRGQGTKPFPLGGNKKGGKSHLRLKKFVTLVLKYYIDIGMGFYASGIIFFYKQQGKAVISKGV